MLPSRGYFSSISCPFFISGNCDRPHCHYRHCKTPTKEYDDEEPIPKRLFRIQATLSHEIKTHFEEEKIRTEKESQQNYGGINPLGPSGYPSTNSNMPGNNRPSNGDYYKRHIPVVYAPAKPTIVRRNSQYVPSVPQNCARPSNINYTPSSRPASNPSSEYKPQSLTYGFDSSVSYKPSQTVRHNADASSYTPKPTGASVSTVSYTPSTTGKTNLDSCYTPSQTGKSYPSASYSPSPTLRTNSDALYAPQGTTNITASYSPTLSSKNSDASYSTNSSSTSYTPSQIRTNSEASYSPSDMVKSSFDLSYSPASSGVRLIGDNYGHKVKSITDAQTSPINSPKRDDVSDDTSISNLKPKTSLNDLSPELSPDVISSALNASDDEMEEDQEEVMDLDADELQVVHNPEKSKHSKEKKSSKEVDNIADKKKDGLYEKAKKESRREHDKNHSKERKEETSDVKKKSISSSESKEKSSSHSQSKNKVTKEEKSKSDSKDSKTTERKEHKHSEKSKSSEKRIKSESSKDGHSSHTSKSDKKGGHSSKTDKKEGHSSSKNEKRKHSSSKDDKTKDAELKADKDKTNGHSKSSHSKSSSKSSHHSKSVERNSHKDKNSSSSEKTHKSTEKKHSSSSSSSSKHRHSSSKSESSRSKHSSSSKEKSRSSSSLKRSSSTEDDLKIKKPKLEDPISIEEDSDDDNQGQIICLDSEDDACDESDLSSNQKEEELVRTTVETIVENTSVDRWVKARETINRNSQGRVRIAHVPNVSSLLSAKEMIMSRNMSRNVSRNTPRNRNTSTSVPKEPAQPTSDYAEPKVSRRVAHTPKTEDLKYPTVKPHENVKINLFTRQACLRNLFDEFVKYICQEDAYKMALQEELEIAKRMNIPKTYQNSMALLVLKIRKNMGILKKNGGPQVEILSSNSIPSFTYGHTIYKCCLNYLVSDEELKRNGFPRRISERPGYACFDTTLSNRFPEKQEGTERVCINCNQSYLIDDNELPIMNDECIYHWGRIFKSKVGGNWTDYYSCCNRDIMMSGCEMAVFHLSNTFDWDALGGFVSTSPPPHYIPEDDAGVFALDCEMCHTTRGSELTRCTVIDLNGNVVYDSIVRPENTILDYCTRFSGITEEIMMKSKTRLADVQAHLLDLFNSNTILVGHSLENDLKALRLFHDRIIDTSILFPHKQGFPYKKALKTLTKEFLEREIQVSEFGHDSKEDAVACLDLLMYKIKQDSKERKPRVIISLPS